jgi:hypothetical protein
MATSGQLCCSSAHIYNNTPKMDYVCLTYSLDQQFHGTDSWTCMCVDVHCMFYIQRFNKGKNFHDGILSPRGECLGDSVSNMQVKLIWCSTSALEALQLSFMWCLMICSPQLFTLIWRLHHLSIGQKCALKIQLVSWCIHHQNT